jgi:hypothetical protein
MNKHSIIILFILLTQTLSAQLYDRHWHGGYMSMLTFEPDTILIDSFRINGDFPSATISNAAGDLRFVYKKTDIYAKGRSLMNSKYELHDSVLAGNLIYNAYDAALFFPIDDHSYWLIHKDNDTSLRGVGGNPTEIKAHKIVDASPWVSHPYIERSKVRLWKFNLPSTEHMTACVHANGKDYWLMFTKANRREYVRFLVTADSIYGPYSQQIGGRYEGVVVGGLCFSNDGTKLAGVSYKSEINIMDFDRCTGLLSNHRSIVVPNDTVYYRGQMEYLGGGGHDVAFSPSGRFLYLSMYNFLYQYDLADPDPALTRYTVWKWDSIYGFSRIFKMKPTPNGRILVTNYDCMPCKGFHLVHEPDKKGAACRFQWDALKAPVENNYGVINNTFNYRLKEAPLPENARHERYRLCIRDSLVLARKKYAHSSYQWLDDRLSPLGVDTSIYVKPLSSTSYFLLIKDSTLSCNFRIDTFSVEVAFDTLIERNFSYAVCKGDSLTIGIEDHPAYTAMRWRAPLDTLASAILLTVNEPLSVTREGYDTLFPCVRYQDRYAAYPLSECTMGEISVYPNPSSGKFMFDFRGSSSAVNRLVVVDVLGRVVRSESLSDMPVHSLDLTSKPSGIYFYKLFDAFGRSLQEGKLIRYE